MAFRTFNGRWYSENGWPYVDEGSCTWVVVPGTNPPVHLQIQNGQSLAILRAWPADFHAFVEPLRDADSACWTPGNKVATSNHPGGTAEDLNWNSHGAGGARNAGFNAAQVATIREMLAFYEGMVYWGNDWNSFIDPMHFQMGYNTYDQNAKRPFPKVDDFIARKIRTDGFSTFRRGGTRDIGPDATTVLANATGITQAKAATILPSVQNGLQSSQCINVERIAMWLAQIGHESDSFNATEEYQKGDGGMTERWKYLGRTWIQITWKVNYAGFSKWCFDRQLVPTPTYFVDRPKELAELKWAGLGPAWYWTVARPNINAMSDNRDMIGVTKAINGGTNGLADRQARYNRALGTGNDLLKLISQPGEDDWLNMPNNQEKLDAIYNALFTPMPPQNIYRDPGDDPGLNLVDSVRAILSMTYEGIVESLALDGDPDSIAKVVRTAKGLAPEQRPWAIARANLIWKLGLAGLKTPPAPAPIAMIDPVVSTAPALLPTAELPAIAAPSQAAIAVQNVAAATPADLLDVLRRLAIFDSEYRALFEQLTKEKEDDHTNPDPGTTVEG